MLDDLVAPAQSVICRDYLAEPLAARYPDLKINDLPDPPGDGGVEEASIVFLNGRLLCYEDEVARLLEEIPPNGIGVKGGYVVGARLSRPVAVEFADYIRKRISEEALARLCEELKQHKESKVESRPRSTEELIMARGPAEGSYEDDHETGQDDVVEKLPKDLTSLIERHGLKVVTTQDARLISFPWQLIEENSKAIEDDFMKLPFRGQAEESIVFGSVQLVGEENIVIGEASVIKPGVVLDASSGPIIIGDGTMVMANATITGPVYVGKQSLVKPGAKILQGTSIGDVCKIGGEVDESIFACYSNKQHDGFIGHSYIGEWVNIGAGANNSDLKNNYSPVRMWCAGMVRETGRQFLGLIMGDHTKTGINTMFNTGTVIGFNCNIFGSEPPPKFVPSFSWGSSKGFEVYDLEKGMQTAEIVMDRREVKFGKAHKQLFKKIFEISRLSSRNV
jgi:UDP-N-acetylglucosamine diphosphorylase/glucosamine-1-phosphate N-acetyltransferase